MDPPLQSSTKSETQRLNEALILAASLIEGPTTKAIADETSFENTTLTQLHMPSKNGGSFPTRSTIWSLAPAHADYVVQPPSLNTLAKQEKNLLQVDLVGSIGPEPKVGALGKRGGNSSITLEESTKLLLQLPLESPQIKGPLADVFQDTRASLQEQHNRFHGQQVSLGPLSTTDNGFFADEAKNIIPILIGPIYKRQAHLFTNTPTIERSPRKKRARETDDDEDEGAVEPKKELSIEEQIAVEERNNPNPIPGTTVYPAHLMPGFNTSSFDAPKDIVLSQLPVYDIDGKVVKPWNLANVLVEGALIVARVTMRAWVVKERSFCQLLATDVRVLHRSGPPSFFIPPEDGTAPVRATEEPVAGASTSRPPPPKPSGTKVARTGESSRVPKKNPGKGKDKATDMDED